ncbi:MAG: aspartate aminotransferase family protein [Candidatus Baldrarchaeia archaeon]
MTEKKFLRPINDLPGPTSSKLMKLRDKYVPKAVYNVTPIFVAESKDALIKDVDGNTYIDFASGISCLNVGHRNPKVIKAIKNQLGRYLHLCFHVTPYKPYIQVAERLAKLAPGNFDKKVVLINSGAEAVENAIKVARRYSRRQKIIAFEHSFHGRTELALSLTASVNPYKYGFGILDIGVHRTPYAYCYRCSFGLEYPSCSMRCIEYIRNTLETYISPDDVAAIIFEPVEGEGGIIVPPKEFPQELRKICNENNILLIADEVQCGMGRTGRMFAVENFGVIPEIITVAKSLGGGMPIGATIGRSDIMDSVQIGGLGGTFGANPLSCVAALESIEIVKGLLGNVRKLGRFLMTRLKEMAEKYEIIGDFRGMGLMAGVELVKDRSTRTPAKEETKQILNECHKNGLIVMTAGVYKNVIRFLPPLNVSRELLDRGLDIFEEALKKFSL